MTSVDYLYKRYKNWIDFVVNDFEKAGGVLDQNQFDRIYSSYRRKENGSIVRLDFPVRFSNLNDFLINPDNHQKAMYTLLIMIAKNIVFVESKNGLNIYTLNKKPQSH